MGTVFSSTATSSNNFNAQPAGQMRRAECLYIIPMGDNIFVKHYGGVNERPGILVESYDDYTVVLCDGTDVNLTISEHEDFLEMVQKRNIKGLKQLLSEKSNIKDAIKNNLIIAQGQTALQLSLAYGSPDMLELFIKEGANVNAVDSENKTVLYHATKAGHIEIVKKLVELSADVKLVDICGETALHLAAKYGYVEIVNLLVYSGADINAEDNNGFTALYYAVVNNHFNTISLLISYESEENNGLVSTEKNANSNSVGEQQANNESTTERHFNNQDIDYINPQFYIDTTQTVDISQAESYLFNQDYDNNPVLCLLELIRIYSEL